MVEMLKILKYQTIEDIQIKGLSMSRPQPNMVVYFGNDIYKLKF